MSYRIDAIRDKFYNLKWYEVYEFIEFIKNEFAIEVGCILDLNKIFEEERAPYRIIGDYVAPITSEVEIREIERSLNILDKYQSVKIHLNKALEYYSKRLNPDYKNSIKESISSLEALARIILKEPKATLGKLVEKLPIHQAFKEALKKLYGWTSDEGGVRHAETGEGIISGEKEARFMLVICSAFVNYISGKCEE